MPRAVTTLAVVTCLAAVCSHRVSAHAGTRLTDPLEGSTLGDTPRMVRLSFSEKPEASLSVIRVLDTSGRAYQVGRPAADADDPLALAIRVRPLDRGVYVVDWRVVSAVDGHVTAGSYAFGVRMSPTGAVSPSTNYPAPSPLEVSARWMLNVGLVLLLGAIAAALAGFGGRSDFGLAVCGWLLAATGVLVLAEAQRRSTSASIGVLLRTPIGRALVLRGAAVLTAGAALLAGSRSTRSARPELHRGRMTAAGLAALAAIAIHVGAGHAAAGSNRYTPALVAAQWTHFSAAGIWLGGLAALLLGTRSGPSDSTAMAVRRFSSVAAAGALLVAATGIVRSLNEIASWSQLTSTPYGRLVMAKAALMIAVVALGAVNRWRSVPAAATNLRPLRRTGAGELMIASGALAAAAILAALAPPATAEVGLRGLSASGADFGTSVRARLTTVSDQPGPNRFELVVTDYDSNTPIRARRLSLRFTPLDDPGIASTSLELTPAPDGSYRGSGANLAFEGRWQVTALVEREADSYEVPLEIETRAVRKPYVFMARPPDQPPMYTVDVPGGALRISVDPERAGRNTLEVTCSDLIGDARQVDPMVVTVASGGQTQQLSLRRLGRGRFVSDVELRRGRTTIAATARSADGTRLRGVFPIDIAR